MSSHNFFDDFSILAKQENSLSQLREVIREMAVRGQLTIRMPDDGNADSLLCEIKEERTRLQNKGIAKSNFKLHQKAIKDPPYSIPQNWKWVRFNEIIWCFRGHNPPKSDFADSPRDGHVRFIQITDFKTDKNAVYVPKTDKLKMVYRGEIVIAAYRHIGKLARNVEGAINVALCKVNEIAPMDRDFIEFLIPTDLVRGELLRASERGHIPSMHSDHLLSLWVPLPPLPEQKRIVAKVDELMALCDELEEGQKREREGRRKACRASLASLTTARKGQELSSAWKRVQDHFEILFDTPETLPDLRQSILQLAVQGKLVEQDEKDEPASTLIDRITNDVLKAVTSKRMKNPKAIPEHEGPLPFPLPMGWCWSQLGKLVAAEENAMCDGPFGSKLKTEHYVMGRGYAVVRLGNIGVGEFIWGKEGHISKEHFESLKNNHIVAGDLIMAGMAHPIARCCEIPPSLGPAINKADCFRVRLHSKINRRYMQHYLNSPIAREFVAGNHHGMTRQRINLTNAKSLPVPLPPMQEQKRIVAKVDQLMSLCDELEAKLKQTEDCGQKLLASAIHAMLASA